MRAGSWKFEWMPQGWPQPFCLVALVPAPLTVCQRQEDFAALASKCRQSWYKKCQGGDADKLGEKRGQRNQRWWDMKRQLNSKMEFTSAKFCTQLKQTGDEWLCLKQVETRTKARQPVVPPSKKEGFLRFISNPTARIAKHSSFPEAREGKLKNSNCSVMKCFFHLLRFKIVIQYCIYAVSGMEGQGSASKSDFWASGSRWTLREKTHGQIAKINRYFSPPLFQWWCHPLSVPILARLVTSLKNVTHGR